MRFDLRGKVNPSAAVKLARRAMLLGVLMLAIGWILVFIPGKQGEVYFHVFGLLTLCMIGSQYLRLYMNGDLEKIDKSEESAVLRGPR